MSNPIPELLQFFVTCFLIEATPGPNMAYLAILSLSDGRRAGLAAVIGVALGLLLVGVIASFGVATLISQSVILFHLLRWGGIFYLLWLAWDGWHGEGETSPHIAGNEHARFFMRGLITNLLNPKAFIFYVAVLPEFVHPQAHMLRQTLTLTVLYVVIATFVHSSIVLLAGTVRPFLQQPRSMRKVRRILSILLAVIAIWFAWSTQ